jgi:hypothetical protein
MDANEEEAFVFGRVSLIVSLVSLLVLVGYFIAIANFSGHEIGRYTVREFDGGILSFPGFQMTEGQYVSHTAGPIELSPDMNPLRMTLHLKQTGVGSVVNERLEYVLRLIDEFGDVVWQQEGMRMESSRSSSTTSKSGISFEPFDVGRKGDYLLVSVFTEASSNDMILVKAEVSIRKNVATVNPIVAWALGLLAATTFVAAMISRGTRR